MIAFLLAGPPSRFSGRHRPVRSGRRNRVAEQLPHASPDAGDGLDVRGRRGLPLPGGRAPAPTAATSGTSIAGHARDGHARFVGAHGGAGPLRAGSPVLNWVCAVGFAAGGGVLVLSALRSPRRVQSSGDGSHSTRRRSLCPAGGGSRHGDHVSP